LSGIYWKLLVGWLVWLVGGLVGVNANANAGADANAHFVPMQLPMPIPFQPTQPNQLCQPTSQTNSTTKHINQTAFKTYYLNN